MTGTRLRDRLSYDDFLTFDGPTGVNVAPEDTRSNFFLHLGLKESNYRHNQLYMLMKQEALAGMERLFSTRDCLEPKFVADERVRPPYSPMQMKEVAFQREIDRIYTIASRQTRGLYDIIHTPDGRNWVIRWMLWRVVEAAQTRGMRASSSDVETVRSMLTTCYTAADSPSVRTDRWSPPYFSPLSHSRSLGVMSPPDLNSDDSDDFDGSVRKTIKLMPDDKNEKSAYRPTGFWDHVMNT